MSYDLDDTICAIGTAAGGAARGMVRVSGHDVVEVVGRVFDAHDRRPLDEIRNATAVSGVVRIALDSDCAYTNPPVTSLYKGGESKSPCDLFLWPTNRSYTREPVAELYTVGSPPLVEAVLAAVCRAGARLAEPGEFTLRAFLAGRLDLSQAEAVLGVIDAGGADELDTALAQLAGGLARPLHQLREDLVQLLAELEAGLDFVDEDIRFVSSREVLERLQSASELLEGVALQMASRHAARQMRQVVLVGPPNVGKSSLFNALVRRRSGSDNIRPNQLAPALVSPQRGTTRDYLTATISLGRTPCELVDTAGVDMGRADGATSTINSAAQTYALERRERAAVCVLCIAAPDIAAGEYAANFSSSSIATEYDILVVTKSDLAAIPVRPTVLSCNCPIVATSSRTGEGLDEFCNALRTFLARDAAPSRGQVIAATAERCGESIRLAANAVQIAAAIVKENAGDELVAMELRTALAELGKVVGAVYTDDLLDRIFKTFCIGK